MGKVLIHVFQFILAVLLAPILYTSIQNFSHYFSAYPDIYREFFYWGFLSFVVTYLFVFRPLVLHQFGQNVVSGLFKFVSPLDKFFSFILPFYVIIIFLLFYAIMILFKTTRLDHYFMFFAGFTFSMQLIFVAQELQEEENSTLKPSYLFIMSLVFILNIFLLTLLFDLILRRFTFPVFFQAMFEDARSIYEAVFHKICSIYHTAVK